MSKSEARIYIGNLPPDIRVKDIEDLFYKYGKIKFVDLKNRKGPPFAFVEYEDARDAEDAIKGRDCYNFDGYKLRVEFQKGNKHDGGGFRGASGGNAPPRRSDNRVIITGLPVSGSWQDLKDHMREAGTVCYADVFRDGTGVVEFIHYDDMKYAIKNLDDTKFKSHEGETGYIRVRADTTTKSRRRSGGGSVSRSRSRSPRERSKHKERGSPTYSPARRSSRSFDSRDSAADNYRGGSSSRRGGKHRRSRSRSDSRSRSRGSRSPYKKTSKRRTKSRSRSRSPAVKRRTKSRSRSRSPAVKRRSPTPASRSRSRSRSVRPGNDEVVARKSVSRERSASVHSEGAARENGTAAAPPVAEN